MSPIQEEDQRSARALAGQVDGAESPVPVEGEQGTLWVLLAVSAANVALGVWRPRVVRVPSGTTSRRSFSAHSPR
jgi:hypothetical protein